MKKSVLFSLILLSLLSCKAEIIPNLPTQSSNTTTSSSDEDFRGILDPYASYKVSECHATLNGEFVRTRTKIFDNEYMIEIFISTTCSSIEDSADKIIATLKFNLDKFTYAGNKVFNANLTLTSVDNNVSGDTSETQLYDQIAEVNSNFSHLSDFINEKVYWTINLDLSISPYGSTDAVVKIPSIKTLLNPTTPNSRSEAEEVLERQSTPI